MTLSKEEIAESREICGKHQEQLCFEPAQSKRDKELADHAREFLPRCLDELEAKDRKIAKLEEALQQISKIRYGAQGYYEERDYEGLSDYYAKEIIRYQSLARQALGS